MIGRVRRMSVRTSIAAASALVALLGLGVSASAGTKQTCSNVDTIRFIHITSPIFTPAYLIDELGLDDAYCIKVETKIVPAAPTVIQTIIAGDSEAGYNSPGTVANALAQGIDLKLLFPADVAKPNNNGIYVAADSSVRNLKDLEGKTIGLLGLSTVAHAAVVERLGRANVDVRRVSFTGYPFAQMVDGIVTGRIDAGQVAEPFLSPAGNRIRLLFPTFSVFGKFPPSTVIVVNGKWARENPSAAQRFHQAWSKAVLYAARNPQAIRDLMVKQNPAFTPAVMAGQIIPGLTVNPGIPALRNELKRMVKLGMLPKQPDYYNVFIRPRATNKGDVLNGWDKADVYNGGGGDDTILGFEGRDTLNGGPGNDTIEAGVAGDTVSGGPGNDVISAIDKRRDRIDCGPGRDLVYADQVDVLVGCERVSRTKPTALLVGLGIEFR